ncbi:MAG: class I SAM-dependent methyltransferase [Candidatus Dojkabacteria bacterium]
MGALEKLLLGSAGEKASPGLDIGRKTKISFPFLEHYISVGPMDMIDPFLQQLYNVGVDIWSLEKLAPDWLAFINEVIDERELIGRDNSINIFSVITLLIDNNPEILLKVKHILDSDFLDDIEVFTDKVKIIQLVNFFLEDLELRNLLRRTLIDYMPFMSANWVQVRDAKEFIKGLNLDGGLVLDLGCGDGENTADLVGAGYKVIGIDKQYFPEQFDGNWRKQQDGLEFKVGDAEHLDYPRNSVDVIVMTSVIGHYTEEAITRILKEARRIVKPNGYILIGPQHLGSIWFDYRVLKKAKRALKEL